MGMDLLELLHRNMPLHSQPFSLPDSQTIGLVIVDEINGFCTPGAGNLAPLSPDSQIAVMVEETDRLAREFSSRNWPMLVFLDTHDASKPEIPYPPHCIEGSGEENLVPALKWLEHDKNAFIMRKNCFNGYIGGIQADGSNLVGDWVRKNKVEMMVVVGICTDICVLDFVVTVLSARNHGILPPLKEVVVYTEGCATFDFPVELARGIDRGLAHPQAVTHYLGLYMAKSRGAIIADSITFPAASSNEVESLAAALYCGVTKCANMGDIIAPLGGSTECVATNRFVISNCSFGQASCKAFEEAVHYEGNADKKALV